MTKREVLQERYEDVMFALMMDTFTRAEGKRAHEYNQTLAEEIPSSLNKACLNTINSYFRKQSAKKARNRICNVLNKIALVALMSLFVFTTAFATSETFRTTTLNFVIDVLDDRTEFRTEVFDKQFTTLESGKIICSWLPNGCVFEESDGGSKSQWNSYSMPNGGYMEICVYSGDSSVVSFDTEDAVVENWVVQEKDAMSIEKGDVVQIVWADEGRGLIWEVYGTDVPKETLLRVAENICFE